MSGFFPAILKFESCRSEKTFFWRWNGNIGEGNGFCFFSGCALFVSRRSHSVPLPELTVQTFYWTESRGVHDLSCCHFSGAQKMSSLLRTVVHDRLTERFSIPFLRDPVHLSGTDVQDTGDSFRIPVFCETTLKNLIYFHETMDFSGYRYPIWENRDMKTTKLIQRRGVCKVYQRRLSFWGGG